MMVELLNHIPGFFGGFGKRDQVQIGVVDCARVGQEFES